MGNILFSNDQYALCLAALHVTLCLTTLEFLPLFNYFGVGNNKLTYLYIARHRAREPKALF